MDSDAEVPPGLTAGELLPSLLDLLGEHDPFLRDDVGYSVLARWVVQDQLLGPDELRYAVERLTPDLRLGLDGARRRRRPAVRRSYSALALALLAYRDVEDQFLDRDEVHAPARRGGRLPARRDRPAGLRPRAWAGSTPPPTPPTCSSSSSATRSPTPTDHRRVLAALQTLLTRTTGPVFVDDEEDRLVLVVVDVIGRETIGDDELCDWIDRFGSWLAEQTGSFDPPARAATVNLKRFIRTLHLALSSRAHRRGLPFDKPEVAALDIARRFAAGPI